MKKLIISRLFLYKHRFGIGYFLLFAAFLALLILLPMITPNGLSEAEIESAITSNNVSVDSVMSGEVVDLPYHALQKVSIKFLGLNPYALKLPSIIIGFFLGILFILLLNRWFKNNVAIITSIIAVLSSSFLYLAGSGTPLIMLVFWPTLLLWLGSKIQGKNKPKPIYSFIFAIFLLLSVMTPYLVYLAVFIALFVLVHPHLRHTIKQLPKVPLILVSLIVLAGFGFIGYITFGHPTTITTLMFMSNFSFNQFFNNIQTAFLPFFSWGGRVESTFLSPMIGLASFALAITGLISTARGFFASRNSLATYLIIFTVLIAGLHPDCAVLLILPLAILIAHGIRYILNKWYSLFPENPYARVFAIFPIGVFLGIMIISDISHFIFGYRYNPPVANQFNNDLVLIRQHVDDDTTLLVPAGTAEYDFYKIIEQRGDQPIWQPTTTPLHITSNVTEVTTPKIASLGKWQNSLDNYRLEHIITSSKSENSDRIYIYTAN